MLETNTRFGRIALQVLVTLFVVPFVFPLAVMVDVSLGGERLGNYSAVLRLPQLPLFFRNSLLIAVSTVVVTYACAMLSSFAFAKLRMRGKEFLFYALLVALTMPSAALTVPLFTVMQNLGALDTFWSVILPLAALAVPLNVMLARSFIAGLPDELLEAARLDGCGPWRILSHVILPLTKPISAVIVVWTFVGAWNEYLLPLLFLQSPETQVVTQLPQFFSSEYGQDQTKIIAGTVVIALPTVVVYLALQRLFERGLTAGAFK
jgi:ABC-type glycerol-3-phosphate transport system permease component